jgi:chromate transporter
MTEADPRGGAPDTAPAPANVSLFQIFTLFLQIGSFSFGGGLVGWLYRELVEKRKWLTETDFLGGLTLSQVLPGINMTNMSVYVGQRLRGWLGALVAVLGLVSVPFFFNIALFTFYAEVQSVPGATAFLDGIASAAVALFLSVGLKSIRNAVRTLGHWAILIAIVFFVGVLSWPMVPVVLCLAPISVLLAWRAGRPYA